MKKLTVAVLLLVTIVSVAQQPPNVSLIALIASPERYDGKQVVVSKFIFLQRERNALYGGKTDFQHALFKNAIYLQLTTNCSSVFID